LPKGLDPIDLAKYARIGAAVRLAELEAEIDALRRAFPGLSAASRGPSAHQGAAVPTTTPAAKQARRGRKHPMTSAERKAVSERMKKYWADRNKTKG